jgi:flagellar biosynthesis/type III secretory pathway M-ring protein FliF/YscJ
MIHVAALHHFLVPYLTHDVYLFSTYITTKKKIAAGVAVVVVVIAVVAWFVWRRQNRARSGV